MGRVLQWLSDWRRYCALLVLTFLVRAVFVLSVLAPFEGWDEYQHLAYVAYVVEHGRSPVLHEQNEVPRSLYPTLVRYPHSKLALEQLGHLGALSYDAFWETGVEPGVAPDAKAISLYQAQHAGLYYRLVAPIYALLADRGDLVAALVALRFVNILFGAAAILVALLAVGKLMKPGPYRYVLGLLITLQPLFLLNSARVANDALAVLLGTIAIASLLVLVQRRYWLGVTLAGAALGSAILAKTVNLSLIPFVVYVFASLVWRRQVCLRRAVMGCVVVLGAVAAITAQYFAFNLSHFSVLTPMQEAVLNHEAGKTVLDAARTAAGIEWWDSFTSKYLRHTLWFGGWSWLRTAPILTKMHQYNIAFAILGGCFALHPVLRRRQRLFAETATTGRLAVLCLAVAAGLAYHAVQSKMALGSMATNSWYAAVSFPWLLCLYNQGLAFYPSRWPARVFAGWLVLVFLAAEVYGTLAVMVPAYTGHAWGPVARERLAQLHPFGVGPEWTFAMLAVAIVLVGLALAVWVEGLRHADRPGPCGAAARP